MSRWIELTDANYGNPYYICAEHIDAMSIVSDVTYREGQIPDGQFRRTVVYTRGGNQHAVRETPQQIMGAIRGVVPYAAPTEERS